MSQQVQLHILDIIARDQKVLAEDEVSREVEFLEIESSDDEGTGYPRKRFKKGGQRASESMEMLIHIFGSRADGTSIRLDVGGFKPYFYIRLPSTGSVSLAIQEIREYLMKNLDLQLAQKIEFEVVKKEILFEFTNSEQFPFLKLTVPSLAAFRATKNLFIDPETQIPRLSETPQSKIRRSEAIRKKTTYTPEYQKLDAPFSGPPDVYEANLDPMLRFLHLQNISPCGWVTCETLTDSELEADADGTLTGRCEWNEVVPLDVPPPRPTAPFLMASWDIECFSRNGDFPVPEKKYANVIKPILEKSVDAADFGTRFVEALFGNGPRIKLTSGRLKPDHVTPVVLSTEFTTLVHNYLERRSEMKVEEKQNHIAGIGKALDDKFHMLAMPAGDPVIQIGTVFRRLGSNEASEQHIFTVDSCDPIEGVIVHSFTKGDDDRRERDMIIAWSEFIAERNPDILTGYNVFGFDERYLWGRARELGLVRGDGFKTETIAEILKLSRLSENGGAVRLDEKRLSSSALGDNFMYIISMQGRLQIDLFTYVKRNFNLLSYKLDEVTKNFMSGKHKSLVMNLTLENNAADKPHLRLGVGKKIAAEVGVGRSIVFLDTLGESLTEKLVVLEVIGDDLILDGSSLNRDDTIAFDPEDVARWVVVKDDVSPQELFKLHQGSAADRAKVGKYCVQDCELVLDLFNKLDVFNNAMSMANVCSVPINYIFSRGQGIKCESLIFKFCNRKNQAILMLPAPAGGFHSNTKKNDDIIAIGPKDENEEDAQNQENDSYEGAIVLEPKAGFYTESPVGVCDFASLYPSTIISENISHDSLVWIRDYNDDGTLREQVFGSEKYDMMEGIAYTDIEFDLLRPDPNDTRKNPAKIKVGTRVCRYAQARQGTIPEILQGLLAKRKATRELIKKETDPFRIALLDAEQNAYKITANSLYGQLGSGTFKVRLQSLAASVTAYGRKQILFAKAAIEKFYGPEAKDPRCSAEIVYGDTDSLFVNFNVRNPLTGERLVGKEAVEATIRITEEAGKFVSGALKAPHDFEFDKVYWPFLIFSKKRYIGNMYEEDAEHFKQMFMGVALKRRDYSPIVKTIYGGAIKILLNQRENPVPSAIEFVRRCLKDLVEGKYSIGQLIISKSLRADYANPLSIAHKVLADRITLRDPGNAPAVGDRIAFVYVATGAGKTAPKLQGDRIETPAFIKANGLTPDYQFYIEHQIANPICQMFGLLLEKFPEMEGLPTPVDTVDREKLAYNLLFGDALAITNKQKISDFARLLGASSQDVVTQPTKKPRAKKASVATETKAVQSKIDSFWADTAMVKHSKDIKKKREKEAKS